MRSDRRAPAARRSRSLWRGAPDAVRDWLQLFASPIIRNRATLGGNLATASPIGDGAPLLLALDAVLHIAGPAGRRKAPLASFFTGYRQTSLGPGELLTAIELPKPLPFLARFYKVAKRRTDDISTVAAGISHGLGRGRPRHTRALRIRRSGRRAVARGRSREDAWWAPGGTTPPCERVQQILSAHTAPDQRSSRLGRVPSGRGAEPAREVLVGARQEAAA